MTFRECSAPQDADAIKVCFTSSSGGHFEQLMMFRPLMEKYEHFIVTEETPYVTNESGNTYFLCQTNRNELLFLWHLARNGLKSLVLIVKERPTVVVSTGALATIPLCILAKLFRSKLVYIESFAKVDSPTQTGKLLYRFADRFYVQWESMRKFYPKAIYVGAVY